MTLKDLQDKVVAFRDAREWRQFHNAKDLAISLCLESSEVLEHFQWRNGDEISERALNKKAEVAEELADVLWYLVLMADEVDVDLEQALQAKLEKNIQRYSVEKAKGNHKKYTELETEP